LHLLPGCDRAHDITAATPLRLLAFGPTELARLLGDSPAFARWLLRWLIERVPPPVGSASGDSDARSLELLSW
jgi:CRP-like cAMP-binding protein